MNKQAYEMGVKLALDDLQDFWEYVDKDKMERSYLQKLQEKPDDPRRQRTIGGATLGGVVGGLAGIPLSQLILARGGSIPAFLAAALGPAALGTGIGALLGRQSAEGVEPITPERWPSMSPEEQEGRLFEHWHRHHT